MSARWKFVTLDGSETYSFPINPNTMTSPVPSRDIQWDHPVSGFTGRQSGSTPHPWSFGGAVRSIEQHQAFVAWTNKRTKIRVHTDLGQVFVIRILAFRPDQGARPRNRHAPWRHQYTFDCLIFKNEGVEVPRMVWSPATFPVTQLEARSQTTQMSILEQSASMRADGKIDYRFKWTTNPLRIISIYVAATSRHVVTGEIKVTGAANGFGNAASGDVTSWWGPPTDHRFVRLDIRSDLGFTGGIANHTTVRSTFLVP